ncbi:hypothetical protein [Nocardia nova]|uniref:hypothetical protein n=1 Tax=Nocardia nova TaxID=37330 RepID=UPI001CA56244|nr:hypothetical protein [Nocardia nova]
MPAFRPPRQIAALRSAARAAAREGAGPILANDAEDPSPPAGRAVTASGLDISIDISHLDVTDLGSFGDRRITGALVEIWGHSRGPDSPAAGVAAPDVEAEGWACAVLDTDWSTHAYVLRNIGGAFTHIFRVLVLLDDDGRPLPAPRTSSSGSSPPR